MERTRKVQQQVNELFAPKFWELIENNKSKLLDWFYYLPIKYYLEYNPKQSR